MPPLPDHGGLEAGPMQRKRGSARVTQITHRLTCALEAHLRRTSCFSRTADACARVWGIW